MSEELEPREPTVPTPASDTRNLLRELLLVWRKLILEFRARGGYAALAPTGDVLSRIVFLSEHPDAFSTMPALPKASPNDTETVVGLLTKLLADSHLTLTCRDTMRVASALQNLGLRQLGNNPGLEQWTESDLDQLADHLVARLFEAAYVRRVYFRFYNLQIDESPLPIPLLDASFQHLGSWDITPITGESTPSSTLHLPETGNVFLVFEDRGPRNDNEWWTARWEEAHAVLRAMKYVGSEVIDIDYSVLHFSPAWVNEVRRYGVSMSGRARADVQAHRYVFSDGDEATLLRYLGAMEFFRPQLEDMTSTLRQAIATAGDYYEGHHTRTGREDQLVDLVIALEALFSPSRGGELAFRIAHRAALLLGSDLEERKTIAAFLKKVYGGRSHLAPIRK
jgi:hypothetical protein